MTDSPHTAPKRVWPVLAGVLTSLLTLWFFLNEVYFIRANLGLFGIFKYLFAPYRFSLDNTPPLELIQAIIVLAMSQCLGVLVIKSLGVRLSAIPRHLMAFPIGFGVSGIAFELLTMARLLHPMPSWLLWIALLGGFWWLAHRKPLKDKLLTGDAQEDFTQPIDRTKSISLPRTPLAWGFVALAAVMFSTITLTIFWHGLLFPETYWDSLILYLGYGQLTFLEHGFPFKAEGQVGIGLGANYPHLFSTYGALASTMFDHWSDLHQRLAAPLAGLVTCGLIYLTVLEAWGKHTIAAAATLLFRSIPYGIAYSTYASDYAFAILFAAALIYGLTLLAGRFSWGVLAMVTLIPAISMHLNYLMGIYWVPWGLVVLWLFFLHRSEGGVVLAVRHAVMSKPLWIIYIAGLTLASPWYIRNTVLTGNPVYAFFPEIFTASVRVNPEVLDSAKLEWFRHGDGVGKMAELFHDFKHGLDRSESDPEYGRLATLGDRIDASFSFWTGFEVLRLNEDKTISSGYWYQRVLHLFRFNMVESEGTTRVGKNWIVLRWRHFWKMAPLFPGIFFPIVLVFLGMTAQSLVWKKSLLLEDKRRLVALTSSALLAFCLLGYMYLLADFYLYQCIPVIAVAAVLGSLLFGLVERQKTLRWVLGPILGIIVLVQSLTPGLAFGLLNFKFNSPREIDGQQFHPFRLDGFRNPGMPRALFYRLAYGDDPLMWEFVNENLQGKKLLTHENRHYVLDPSIQLVHLDDWDIQQGYDLETAEEIVTYLDSLDVHYYLRIPKEKNHPINRRLGMDKVEAAGYLELMYEINNGGETTKLYKINTTKSGE